MATLDYQALRLRQPLLRGARRVHAPRDPKLQPRCVQWAEIDGRKYHVIGGKLSHAVVEPDLRTRSRSPARCTSTSAATRTAQPARDAARPRAAARPTTWTATRACAMIDEQGLEAHLAVPDAGRALRGAAQARHRGRRARCSAPSTAGSTRTGAVAYQDRIFARALHHAGRPATGRCASSSGRSPAARAWSCMRPGRRLDRGGAALAGRPDASIRSGRASNEAGITVRRARRRLRLHARTATRATASPPSFERRQITPSVKSFNIERAAYDFLITLVFEKLFERFPNLRIASVENGSEFLPDLFRKLRRRRASMPGYFKEDPVETFRRHVWINPFWEDDVNEVVRADGRRPRDLRLRLAAHRGLPQPLDYLSELRSSTRTRSAGSCATTRGS